MRKYGGRGVKKQSCLQRPPCARPRPGSKPSKTRTSTKQSLVKNNVRSKKVAVPEPIVATRIASEVKTRQVRRSAEQEKGESSNRKMSDSLVERPKLNKYATVNGSEDLVIRKNKMDQIKEKFKLQEKALKGGKTSMLNLSKEELLFGFHL